MSDPKIALALGSGSSRGWSHIGVINALTELGIEPDIICGTSIGAFVGASYAAGNLDTLQQWAESLNKLETARLFTINSSFNGFVDTTKMQSIMCDVVAKDDAQIEALTKKFAGVATDLETGREIWLTEGPVLEAVWASMSLPGLFPAVHINDQWLVDGGLVNPVPVSVCRAMGAEYVIAVNLNGDLLGRHLHNGARKRGRKKSNGKGNNKKQSSRNDQQDNGLVDKFTSMVGDYTASFFSSRDDKPNSPGLLETIASSVNITQDRITKSRMVGDPPDIVITPELSQIGLLELYRAKEAIREGARCVKSSQAEIERVLKL